MREKKTFIITLFIIISLILAVMTVMASAEAKTKLSAKSLALYMPDTDTFLMERNADARLPMASTTKIMTAIVVAENADLSDTVTVTKEAVGTEGSSLYLKDGDVATVEDLLYALMLRSANDVAVALAVHVSGSVEKFAEKMNEKASLLGLRDTSFQNPHGLDSEGHYTTAHDLAIIAKEAISNPTLKTITSTYKHVISVSGSERILVNHNKLLQRYDGVTGVKTGYTKKSGRCLVSSAERGGVALICVTLDAPDDWRDHTTLLDYGFSSIKSTYLSEIVKIKIEIPTEGGIPESISASAEDIRIFSLRDDKITAKYDIPSSLTGTHKKGEKIGLIRIYKNGEPYKEVPITLDAPLIMIGIP